MQGDWDGGLERVEWVATVKLLLRMSNLERS
jgi:hypothetical protein